MTHTRIYNGELLLQGRFPSPKMVAIDVFGFLQGNTSGLWPLRLAIGTISLMLNFLRPYGGGHGIETFPPRNAVFTS